jgi:hypothetical protein
VHGLAADRAAARYGDRGMVASDLLERIPRAIKQVLRESGDAGNVQRPSRDGA